MNTNRVKAAAEWFYNTIFKEEAIRPRPPRKEDILPSMLRTARSLENGPHQNWQSRESVFMKQAKLLANYEDDCDYQGNATHYYPTYQALSDQELRGYFSWRTGVRGGDVRQTSLSFAFLYIYELINQIGVSDPLDGYHKLSAFRDAYGQIDGGILPYLKRWMVDYVIYYGLDPAFLAGSPQVIFDRSITVLEHVQEQDATKVIYAVRQLSPKWLERSRFYAAYQEDMDAVIVRVLRRMSAHYDSRCKKTLVEQYFGGFAQYQVRLFDAAVFCNPLKRRSYEYAVDEQYSYRCENGLWSVRKRTITPSSAGRMDALLKTVDSVMRQEFDYRHPVKAELETKWVLRIIEEEVRALLDGKRAAESNKITIDYAQLAKIRRDAAATQEKLIVEEEMDGPPAPTEIPLDDEQIRLVPAAEPVAQEPSGQVDGLLAPVEYRLLQCLLYGRDAGWVPAEGWLLSVLVDGINEKLFDTFQDSVLDDTPQLVEDYIDELKEMVRP